MSRNIQLSVGIDKAYPYTISDAVYVTTDTSIVTLTDKLNSLSSSIDSGGLAYTLAEKTKLANIDNNANYYVLPSTLPASMIVEDSNNRFVTDAQINTWANTSSTVAQSLTDNLTNSKAYTDQKIANLVNSSPTTLDTLNELAQALGDDPNFATTITNKIGLKSDTTYVDGKLATKYDKTGGAITGQINASIGVSKGISFGTTYISSVDGTDLSVAKTSSLRFTDGNIDLDNSGALVFNTTDKTIYFGGGNGGKIPDGGSPYDVTVDMTETNSGVSALNVTTLNVGSSLGISGQLTFADSGTVFRGITGVMGGNDAWRVGGSATSTDNGYMEIATSDGGNEPIYVRQYTGGLGANSFTTPNLLRTLTLLDASGNTILPGNLTAVNGTFSGPVTAPTAATTTNTTQVATTAFVNNYVAARKVKLNQYHSTSTITANTMTINISIASFDNTTDALLVYKNGLIITDDDYTLNGSTSITSKDTTNGFIATSAQPAVFTFVILKNTIV